MPLRLGYVLLYVSEVRPALQFYEKAFGFETKFVTDEGDYGELDTGATTLGFVSESLADSNLISNGFEPVRAQDKPKGFEVAFASEDLEADIARAVEAGATLVEPVREKPWGQKLAYLRDENGFLIELYSPAACEGGDDKAS